MIAGKAREFLGSIKSAAAAQRMRFMSCLALGILSLAARSALAVFYASIAVGYRRQSLAVCADICGSCQSSPALMFEWYIRTNTLVPLVFSLSSTLPLMFALWLMTTKEDRRMLIDPGRYRVDEVRPSSDALLNAECQRMGVALL